MTTLLSWIGLLTVLVGVYFAAKALADAIVRREEMRDVLTGRTPPPWDDDITSAPLTWPGPYNQADEDR